jgi:SRSO17 transposase
MGEEDLLVAGVSLPGRRGRHRLSTEQVVGSRVIEGVWSNKEKLEREMSQHRSTRVG